MSNETDLDELSILKNGYERFLSSPGDLANCENAIITVRRAQQIITQKKNKIKVSLSQEQILNQTNRYPSSMMKRSQSTNIQKTLASSNSIVRSNRVNLIRPSLIPVKIKDQSKLRALTLSPNQKSPDSSQDASKYRSFRKMSAPIERRNYVSHQESTLSSLPLTMTQSLDLRNDHDDRLDLLDKFKCRICFNIIRNSRVLNCLHTFCMECLYSIENSIQPKTTPNKLNPNARSNSFEKTEMNCSHEFKESDRQLMSSSMSNKPIRKPFSTTLKKRSVELKQQQKTKSVPQQKRPPSLITEKGRVSLKCPLCLLRTEIPIGGVSRVPKNFLLERQLQDEIYKICLKNENCNQCYDEIKAHAYCLNCDINLCNVCQGVHMRQRWTSKHMVISLPDIKKEKHQGLQTSLKCFVHPTQDLKLYCINCNIVACQNCTILLHKGHKFESIERAKQHIIKKFSESVEQNQRYHDFVNESISKLNGAIVKINDKAEIVKMEIEIFFKDYIEAIEGHKESLLQQIIKAKESKSFSVMDQQEYLEKRVLETKQANQFAKNLLENGSDIEILTFIGVLQNRFEFCQTPRIRSEPKISNSFQFLRDIRAPITSQQNNIPVYGVLSIEDITAMKSLLPC
ncbi:tripartite motif-containing protein 45 [Contarinia nasturtii]|uniref:tripartite motif-containing protein 45 n=1 Tax=Contarinia nasturtii TaxID=265458 RepID=UPI0012D46DC9|nr:tripartite motif-containing protein 45 [Contarinia nasturtii]